MMFDVYRNILRDEEVTVYLLEVRVWNHALLLLLLHPPSNCLTTVVCLFFHSPPCFFFPAAALHVVFDTSFSALFFSFLFFFPLHGSRGLVACWFVQVCLLK